MKTTHFYTHASRSIRWDSDKCLHGGKCLKCVLLVTKKPGEYSFPVSEKQFDEILMLATYCPARALRMLDD